MIDTNVAKWVNQNLRAHNVNRSNKLLCFKMDRTSLQGNDFPSYLKWVGWCQESAALLTRLTDQHWRARDVEMAVFTAWRQRLPLNVLP